MKQTKSTSRKKIVVIHMRNDLSGSTRVLAQALRALSRSGFIIDLFYAHAEYPGFLSELPSTIKTHRIPYKRSGKRWITFVSYKFSQAWLFFSLFRYLSRPVKFYVNTVLPFGAALAGWFMRKQVIYHVHEISLAPAPPVLKRFLFAVVKLTATRAIAVSNYLAAQLDLPETKLVTIHNSLSARFVEEAKTRRSSPKDLESFVVLMVCSLASYKGVNKFIELARIMPDVQFDLLLNATQSEIDLILGGVDLQESLTIHSAVSNVHPFYQKTSVLLNLSDGNHHIETFGMTILEGMTYGLPCIGPTVGGVTELIDHGVNGYLIDSRQIDTIRNTIYELRENKTLYSSISNAAIQKSEQFSADSFHKQVKRAFG